MDAAGGTGGHFSTFQLEGPSVTGLALDESGLTVEDRDSETLCPMGYYCVDGLRHKCPAVSGGWWPEGPVGQQASMRWLNVGLSFVFLVFPVLRALGCTR